MSHALVDRYEDPARVIAILNRRRHLKVVAVIGGLILAVVLMIATSAVMYADGPDAARRPPAADF